MIVVEKPMTAEAVKTVQFQMAFKIGHSEKPLQSIGTHLPF
jgi:hypothetical protein